MSSIGVSSLNQGGYFGFDEIGGDLVYDQVAFTKDFFCNHGVHDAGYGCGVQVFFDVFDAQGQVFVGFGFKGAFELVSVHGLPP